MEPLIVPRGHGKRKRSFDETLNRLAPNRPEGECWEWTGDLAGNGYGFISRYTNGKRKRHLAHRVAYEQWVGPIPNGLVIDHLCMNKRCVNPDHLEPVLQEENQHRGVGWNDGRCKRGHELTPENLYISRTTGKVQCRGCWTSRRQEKRANA